MKRITLIILMLFIITNIFSQETKKDEILKVENSKSDKGFPFIRYNIEAKLFPIEKQLLGSEIIEFENQTNKKLDALYFHLYYNAFKNTKSSFLKESGFDLLSNKELKDYKFGGIKINEIRIIEGEELTNKIEYISPDDNNKDDKTLIRIKLSEPILPFQRIQIKINFELIIPKIFQRTGYVKDYFFIAQWYPKLCELNEQGKWNAHQFHKNSEFFSNFADYIVKITIPERFKIASSGYLLRKENNQTTITYEFFQKKIHDFAFALYPYFNLIIDKIKLKGNDKETQIEIYYPPNHLNIAKRYLKILKFTMNFYAENIFPYPYKKITVVDPPIIGLKSGGMEYPTLITTGSLRILPNNLFMSELVTCHEFGHQYWYGIIATNEFEEAWLDEGINTFFEYEIMDKYFKRTPSFYNGNFFKIFDWQFGRVSYLLTPSIDKVNKNSWDFMNSNQYSTNVYNKTALLLRSLKNHLGEKRFYEFFRFYAERYKYKHPSTNDFINTFNEFFKEDFTWAFDQYINKNTKVDNAVLKVNSKKIGKKYKNTVIFARLKGFFPVKLLIKLRNNKEIKYFWNTKENWKKIELIEDSPIEFASIDPNYEIVLDTNFLNNRIYLSNKRNGLSKFLLKISFYFQNILSTILF